jgi:hypothetical protein
MRIPFPYVILLLILYVALFYPMLTWGEFVLGKLPATFYGESIVIGIFLAGVHYIDNVIVAFWLAGNVDRFEEDRFTWFIFGLAFGLPALVLFAAWLVYDHKYGKKFRNSISALIVICLVSALFSFSDHLVMPVLNAKFSQMAMSQSSLVASFLTFYHVFWMILVRFILMLFMQRLITRNGHAWIWGLATLVFGVFPFVLKLILSVYHRRKVFEGNDAPSVA